MSVDHRETTWVVEPDTIELYTTERRVWLRAIARNPDFLHCVELEPGYRIVWGRGAAKSPEMLLKSAPGGADVVQQYLTASEVAARQAASDRIRAIRAERPQHA